jgi:hypothetical protein
MNLLKSKRARILFVVLLVAKLALLALVLSAVLVGGKGEYASCHECFCIPDEGEACPIDRLPDAAANSGAASDLVPKLRSIRHDNPLNLTCDPYLDAAGCARAQGGEAGRGAANASSAAAADALACVVDYAFESVGSCPASYRLRTYPGSAEDARGDGLAVTHSGPCGACSSLQDLAAYLEQGPGLRGSAAACGIRGRLRGEAEGVSCFLGLGFTESCARIWFYSARNTARRCLRECAPFVLLGGSPNAASEPGCPLAPCLECDEERSGPVFRRFAGRTRRNSGLRSSIARRCSEVAVLPLHDPCDQITSPSSVLLPVPVEEGTSASKGRYENESQYVGEVRLPRASSADALQLH